MGRAPTDAEARYKTVCLLDDFTASGKTYLRDENGTPDGKIAKIWRKLKDTNSEFSAFVDQDNVEILIIIYIAAAQAINYLDDQLPKQLSLSKDVLRVVHKLAASCRVEEPEDQNFLKTRGR